MLVHGNPYTPAEFDRAFGHLADITPPTTADAGAGYPYINGFALRSDGAEIVVALCTRGYCGFQGIPSRDAQTGLLRSLDGGVTWTTWGILEGSYRVFAITEDGAVLQGPYALGPDPSTYTPAGLTIFPSGDPLSPPAEVVLQGPFMPSGEQTRPIALSTGELLWTVAGRLLRTDGTEFLAAGKGREFAWAPGGVLWKDAGRDLLAPVVWETRGFSGVDTLLVVDQGRTINEFSLDGFAHIAGRLDSGLLVGNVSLPREQLNSNPSLLQRFAEDPEGWFIVSPEALTRNPSLPFVGYLPALFDMNAGRAHPIADPFLDGPLRNGRNHVLAALQGPLGRVINTGSCLNVRAEPGADAPVLACMADGVLLRHADETSEEIDQTWLRVVTPRGEEGWASTTYLEYR